ncbi:hypothetical protein EE612_035136, partial [Oryza sativa]
MDAEMLKCQLEIGNVWLDLHLEDLLGNQCGHEEQLLRQWEHERPEGGDVRLQRVSGHRHQVLGERHANLADLVFLLGDTAKALVVGALVRAHGVHKLILGPPAVGPPVRQQDGGAAHPEQAIRHEHRPVVAKVPIERDVLHADHQRVRVWVHLQQVLGEIDGQQAGTAPHPAEVVADDIPPQLVVVHNHGGQRRRRVEQAAIDDNHTNVLGLHTRLLKKLVNGAEHDGAGLLAGLVHAGVGRDAQHGGREVGVLAEAGALEDLALEVEVGVGEGAGEAGAAHECLAGALALGFGLVAGEVEEVDGAGAGEEVEGGEEDEEGGAGDDGEEVEAELLPQVGDVAWGHGGELHGHQRHQRRQQQVHAVGDEVVVPQLHVLEPHRLLEVRQPTPLLLLRRRRAAIGRRRRR